MRNNIRANPETIKPYKHGLVGWIIRKENLIKCCPAQIKIMKRWTNRRLDLGLSRRKISSLDTQSNTTTLPTSF